MCPDPLVKKFYAFYDGLNDTQKSVFVDESLTLLQSIKFAVSKLVEYVSFGHPIPTGFVTVTFPPSPPL